VAGYADAASAPVAVAVTSKLTLTGPSITSGGRPATLTVQLTAGRAGTVAVSELVGGSWQRLATASAASTGRAVLSLAGLALGTHVLRAEFDGDGRGGAAASSAISISVRV
jgi:hypothetical protein